MKLFKKLAAAALAAVLALSMVGCGAGSKGSTSTASELANMLVDSLDQTQIGAKHTGDMDNLAVALATRAFSAFPALVASAAASLSISPVCLASIC